MVREEEEKSRWWWFESHKSSNHSQWLHSTLAGSFPLRSTTPLPSSIAQRAETYYKKRPELITIVEDFYRAIRSLEIII
ncbi:unnamed protein product [Arabis nemorensis]|uniref:NAB domain-containing protein n=1 Tax=Arabis nemorensis TaxID=586526 RepID=A0A565BQL7_9BRAS|nr:unnamed protein product [Arabis nemorensis]